MKFKALAAAGIVALAGYGAGAGTALAQAEGVPAELKALYEAAVAEGGEVLVYSQIVPTTLETIARQWEKRFPDVEFNYVRLTTAPMIERVNAELSSGKPSADVVMVSDTVWPEDLHKDGKIQAYDLPDYGIWPDQYKRDKYYFVSQMYVSAVFYNTNLVKPEDAPKGYMDVLKFENRANLSDPRAGGGNASIMFGTMELFGDSFWKKAAEAGVEYSASVAQATPKVVSGDALASIHTHSFPACQEAEGRPVKTVYPPEGVFSTKAVTFGTAGAAHPKAAALFMAYMMSEEGQNFINVSDCTYSVRPGVKLNKALPPLETIKVINISADEWREKGAAYRETATRAAGVPIN